MPCVTFMFFAIALLCGNAVFRDGAADSIWPHVGFLTGALGFVSCLVVSFVRWVLVMLRAEEAKAMVGESGFTPLSQVAQSNKRESRVLRSSRGTESWPSSPPQSSITRRS